MPDWKPEILRRIASLSLAPTREAEIAEELAQHLEDRYQELLASGKTDDQAMATTIEELKGSDLLVGSLKSIEKEKYFEPNPTGREAGNFFSGVLQDIRYALRMLRKSPGFTTVAVLTLALGIGATSAIFTVVDRVILAPVPYPHANRLVTLVRRVGSSVSWPVSVPEYLMWRSETGIIENADAAASNIAPVNLLGGDHPEQLPALRVSANFFSLYGYSVGMGRSFTLEEDVPGAPPVAVISNGLWQRRFGSDSHVVGKIIDLNNAAYTVIGVLLPIPRSDEGTVDIYLPLQLDADSANVGNDLTASAWLRPGVSLSQANAALNLATEQFRRRYPKVLGRQEVFAAVSYDDLFIAGVKQELLLFLGAVGFVLLIACANVANLLLGRETGRQREIAIRVVLGASRRRIVRQILTESVLLSLAGGAAGLVLGYAGVRALLAINPGQLPWVGQHGQAVTLDWRLLLFALGISAVTGTLAGLIPAIRASRSNLAATINESGTRAGTGLRHNKTRSLLVVAEMALTMVLLAGAGLLIRTYGDLHSVDPGFQTHDVLTMDMLLTGTRFAKTAPVAQLVREGRERLDRLPGVLASGASCCLPLQESANLPFNIEGRAPTQGQWSGGAGWRSVSPGYFEAFRIPLLQGRAFSVNDSDSSPPVVIINEAMAKQFWSKGDELGTNITIGKGLDPQLADPPREIVGVVGDVRDEGLNYKPVPTLYVPVAQLTDKMNALANRLLPLVWVIQTRVPPASLDQEVQQQLRIASGGLPVGEVRTMDQVVAQSTQQNTFNMTLLVIFAALALLLSSIGIYGVISYTAGQRTHEIGIRMALGAQRRDVLRLVLGQGTHLAIIGIAAGAAAALGLTRLMAGWLFGVTSTDPLTFAAVAITLLGVALLACYIPARRAMRVDPMIALRYE